MVVVRGRLEPEAGAVLMKAVEAGREALYRRRDDVSAETRPDGLPPARLDSVSVAGAVSRRCFGFVSDNAMRPDNS